MDIPTRIKSMRDDARLARQIATECAPDDQRSPRRMTSEVATKSAAKPALDDQRRTAVRSLPALEG